MTKKTCDLCGDEMPEDYEPKFVYTYGTRKIRAVLSLVDDEGDGGEDICKACAKQSLEQPGFIEDDDC